MKKYGWAIFFLGLSIITGIRAYFMYQNENIREYAFGSIKFAIVLAIGFLLIAIQRADVFKLKQ